MRASSRGVDWEQARQDVILEEEAICCVLGLGCRAVLPRCTEAYTRRMLDQAADVLLEDFATEWAK